jgi:hypothetical protein
MTTRDDAPQPVTLLSRNDILGAADIDYEVIDVPEWGGKVRIKEMTAEERDNYEDASFVERKDDKTGAVTRVQSFKNARAKLISMAIVDAQGVALFTTKDVVLLGRKSSAALQRVFEATLKLNAMTQADVEALGEGSAETPGGGSPSDSPSQ